MNSVLSSLIFDPTKGEISYQGIRYLLIRPETLATWQKGVEKALGSNAGEIIFEGGREGGSLSARTFRDKHGYSSREIVDFMTRMGTEIGWGQMKVLKHNEETKRFVIEVSDSPFAAAYGNSSAGVCHLIRGVMAGVGEGIFGDPVEARETSCLAMGNQTCRFIIEGLK